MNEFKQKWTPGPWMAAAKPSSIVGWPVVQTRIGRMICDVNYVQHNQIDPAVTGDRAFNTESGANARLIAAAPDLYEALAAYHDHFGGLEDNSMLHEDARRCSQLARAALAKARGE